MNYTQFERSPLEGLKKKSVAKIVKKRAKKKIQTQHLHFLLTKVDAIEKKILKLQSQIQKLEALTLK